ncbi:hypothetical protein MRI28_28385 [Nocardiopsis dassonvillei]|uniref:hypothetical protein n=1 Tax=Nocardiopsis dassonvillei TaxID=2014 RepID=UPI00200D1CFD|nr:hypothetical protein [Nocardiopsis dassonvillei]MCK9873493.1 hypothetical protein [Nocardiopsis dassonvillei]
MEQVDNGVVRVGQLRRSASIATTFSSVMAAVRSSDPRNTCDLGSLRGCQSRFEQNGHSDPGLVIGAINGPFGPVLGDCAFDHAWTHPHAMYRQRGRQHRPVDALAQSDRGIGGHPCGMNGLMTG